MASVQITQQPSNQTASVGQSATFSVSASGGCALVEVEDEGVGVSEADREQVFERFHGRGSGLGLAIVRATAERHGGRAYVDGSRFTLELPIVRNVSDDPGIPTAKNSEKGLP